MLTDGASKNLKLYSHQSRAHHHHDQKAIVVQKCSPVLPLFTLVTFIRWFHGIIEKVSIKISVISMIYVHSFSFIPIFFLSLPIQLRLTWVVYLRMLPCPSPLIKVCLEQTTRNYGHVARPKVNKLLENWEHPYDSYSTALAFKSIKSRIIKLLCQSTWFMSILLSSCTIIPCSLVQYKNE